VVPLREPEDGSREILLRGGWFLDGNLFHDGPFAMVFLILTRGVRVWRLRPVDVEPAEYRWAVSASHRPQTAFEEMRIGMAQRIATAPSLTRRLQERLLELRRAAPAEPARAAGQAAIHEPGLCHRR
jgi:hypothetical protein